MIGDVVDEQEGVGAQVGCGPEPAIFFLAGRVGKGEEIGFSVDGARNRVGVLWERGSRAWLAKGWGLREEGGSLRGSSPWGGGFGRVCYLLWDRT